MIFLLMSPYNNDGGYWGKRWTSIHRMGHKIHWVIEVPCAITWDTHILIFFVCSERTVCISVSFHLLLPVFPTCSFQVCGLVKLGTTAHRSIYNCKFGHYSFQAKCTAKFTAQSSCHCEDFPSELQGYSCLLPCGNNMLYRAFSKYSCSLFFIWQMGERRQWGKAGTMDIWLTSSCHLFQPSGPSQVWAFSCTTSIW